MIQLPSPSSPIKAWSARETHFVVRSGTTDIGAWQQQERNVAADVSAALGELPAGIVAVWLIAVATFQHGRASAEFESIHIKDGGLARVIL